MNLPQENQAKLSANLQEITSNLLTRINSGCASLSNLEKMLLGYIEKNRDTIHPDFLLEVCKYFRISVNSETKAVLDFIANSKSGRPYSKSPIPSELVDKIGELPDERRGIVISAISEERQTR